MSHEDKASFFDGIAPKWDGWQELDELAVTLDAGLASFGMGERENVLDVGCGTGNLTRALLKRLASDGRVTAVDLSSEMIETAKQKISYSRVTWRVADALDLPAADRSFDRVICYSVWPHFEDHPAVLKELARALKPGGMLHIWHLSSRQVINDIHASAGPAVKNDVLLPVGETRALLEANGFHPVVADEDDTHYLISAVKPSRAT